MITTWIFQCFLSRAGMCGSDLFSSWKCYRNRKTSALVCLVVSCLCLAGVLVWLSCTSLPLCSGLNKGNLEWAPAAPIESPQQQTSPFISWFHAVYCLSWLQVFSWKGVREKRHKVGFCRPPLMSCDFKGSCLFWVSLLAYQKVPLG